MPPGLFEPPPLLGNRRFGGPVSLRNRNRARAKKRAGKQSGSRTTRQAPSSAAARPHNHSSFHQASWLMQYICRSIYPLSWCAVRDWARGEPEEMLRGKEEMPRRYTTFANSTCDRLSEISAHLDGVDGRRWHACGGSGCRHPHSEAYSPQRRHFFERRSCRGTVESGKGDRMKWRTRQWKTDRWGGENELKPSIFFSFFFYPATGLPPMKT